MRTARIRLAGRTAPETVRFDPRVGSAEFTGFEPVPAGGWLPPSTGMVYGVILNDRASLELYGGRMTKPPHVKPPVAPVLYFKPYNTHAGHQAVVELPHGVERVELGATLGVVFGATCGRAPVAAALDAVEGYTLAIDVSVPKKDLYRPPVVEKCFDHSCPLGPWLVDRADIPDPSRLVLRTMIDNETVHTRTLDDLARPVPQLIADISEFMSFYAGDVLLVGYPLTVPTAGAGGAIAVECDAIGRLECRLTAPAGIGTLAGAAPR
jgi:5-oxopent-3-ene-1,2,5-tricarboxylate decarboxylase / 2-hydroxyhepta-2,4-diene-1,7-dioate isomerase